VSSFAGVADIAQGAPGVDGSYARAIVCSKRG